MDFVSHILILAVSLFVAVKFVLCPLLAPLDKISKEDFKEAFGYDKNFHKGEIKDTFIAFFLALYFYVKGRYFRYLLLSKCFFGMNFKFWFNPNKNIFQFIIIKGYEAIHGAEVEFSFFNLYKDLKCLLTGFKMKIIKGA